ncbi:unnamed protein product [Medioppia subpectinata]|uniref:MD-2-related lipid-recognition domain-containing protein n=1 Tax=Medioppia subpectinata TaxID=1979941 RepID=A0A7R9PV66_9ACAR|nr:unnamed protein product [Medioppia subpectinata]CAG2101540.1 unnamed protein product [Medioppia subpectinata]
MGIEDLLDEEEADDISSGSECDAMEESDHLTDTEQSANSAEDEEDTRDIASNCNSSQSSQKITKAGITKTFNIEGCDGSHVCTLKGGNKLSVSLDYQVVLDYDDTEARFEMFAHWSPTPGQVVVSDLISSTDACHYTACPIRKGVAQKLTLDTTVRYDVFNVDVHNVTLYAQIHGIKSGHLLECTSVTVDILK